MIIVVPILPLPLRRCQTNSRRWACDELPVYNLNVTSTAFQPRASSFWSYFRIFRDLVMAVLVLVGCAAESHFGQGIE